MNAITKSRIYLPLVAMLLAVTLAGPAAAQKLVPFKGVLQGHDADSPGPSAETVTVTTTGDGIATQLGNFTFRQQTVVNLTTGVDTGTAHFVAANGDTLDATIVGSGEPIAIPGGVVISITETYTITGGTGRFAGAQGSFTMERLANPQTFFTSGSFHGSITSPGASH